MSGLTAHILEQKWRSDDIRIGEDVDFSSLLLPKEILKGLSGAGFKYPSPIQLKAIPVGKIGKDLIVQAKSGTGKTLVFTVVALNMLLKGATHPQVLIMAPTREIACQIRNVIQSVGVSYKGLKCEYFIGGRPLEEDVSRIQGCQVIVGTPGRIKHLISYKILKTAGIRLFVLDEADQLLKESSFTTDIDDIFRALPRDKQMIATSATYPVKLKRIIDKYFRDPLLIRLNKKDIGLLGMVHYYHVIPVSKLPVIAYREKLKFLENVLLSVKFAQCLVFCNMVSRVENLCVEIKKWGFATSYISSAREQEDRLKAIELLKRFKCKVLVSSDLSSRGIDAENVDLVINFDLPSQLDTYFHRVGRAGRYGSKCASVTFITSDEIEAYARMQTDGNFTSYSLPDLVPEDLISLEPKTKCCVENEESPLDDGSESSDEEEDITVNGVVKQEKTNGLRNGIELNGHNKLSCTSKAENFASENLTNSSDEKLVDIEVKSTESGNSFEIQNQLLDLNSSPTNSVKEGDDLSSTLESVELKFDKIDSPASLKLKQPEVVSDVSSSSEIVAVEDENNLKENEINAEEKCENNKLVEKIFNQEEENTVPNSPPKSDELASNIDGLKQITNTSSSLVDLENDSKTIDVKSLAISNELNTSKNLNNPKSKELITSFITFIQKYENCNESSEEFSFADNAKSSQSTNVESNDSKISPEYLKHYISGLNQYHYDVRKDFMNSSEDLINEIAQGCGKEKSVNVPELKEQTCLKQNDDGNKIENSSLDSHLIVFSTPKADTLSDVKSGNSSGVESSSGSDKDKLIEHFNLRLATIHKVKPSTNKNSRSESSSGSESSLDTSKNSEDAMHMLTEEFNKVSQERAKCCNKEAANIINYGESSCSSSSSSSDSDSDTSIDSEKAADKLEQKFTDLMKAKRSDGGPNKDMEEAKKILREIQSTKKCFKGIEIVETKKITESSTCTSSDSDTSIESRNVKDDPKKDKRIRNVKSEASNNKKIAESSTSTSDSDTSLESRSGKEDKRIQNVKSKVFNNKKSSESSSYKKNTLSGHAKNKFTYSDTESDVDQFSLESAVLQDGPQRKTCKKDETVSKTGFGCRKKIAKNKIYSGTSSSETEKDIYQYSKESNSRLQVGHQCKRKNIKNDETLSKTETSLFDYSNANVISNPYSNPASERPIICPPHFNYQMQPPHASYPYDSQYSQQRQNQAGQGPFWGTHSNYQMQPTYKYNASNLYHTSQSQQIQSHANGQFSGPQCSHHMQSAYVPNPLSQPYHSECPLKEHCKMQLGSNRAGNGHTAGCSTDNFISQRNSDPSTNVQSNYLMQPSHAYNQCCAPSQHPCHPPNETCQSPACAAWYDIFYKQWQFINQAPYF